MTPTPMTVTGRRRRLIDLTSFVGITDVPVLDVAPAGGDLTAVIFADELDAAEVALVLARMDSLGPVDESLRADLRTKRDAVLGNDATAQAVRAAINYLLGESP